MANQYYCAGLAHGFIAGLIFVLFIYATTLVKNRS